MKEQYDDVWKNDHVDVHFKADIPQKMLELFKQENVQNILDLGSGDGTIAITLAKKGKNVYALEISHEGIEKTKARAKAAQVSVHTLKQDMYRPLPFDERSLDSVVARDREALCRDQTHPEGRWSVCREDRKL